MFALVKARFHYAYDNCLKLATSNNSLDRSTKSTPSLINQLRLLVRTQFQGLFHSPSGVLLTFPSRYLFSIDRKIYLALGGGPPGFSQGFTCPDLLDNTNDKVCKSFTYQAITVYGIAFQLFLLTLQFIPHAGFW